MQKKSFESAGHEKAEDAAMKDWHAAEASERAAKKKGDRKAWEAAEKKEHGALARLNKAEQKEHGQKVAAQKFSSMRNELEKISLGPLGLMVGGMAVKGLAKMAPRLALRAGAAGAKAGATGVGKALAGRAAARGIAKMAPTVSRLGTGAMTLGSMGVGFGGTRSEPAQSY